MAAEGSSLVDTAALEHVRDTLDNGFGAKTHLERRAKLGRVLPTIEKYCKEAVLSKFADCTDRLQSQVLEDHPALLDGAAQPGPDSGSPTRADPPALPGSPPVPLDIPSLAVLRSSPAAQLPVADLSTSLREASAARPASADPASAARPIPAFAAAPLVNRSASVDSLSQSIDRLNGVGQGGPSAQSDIPLAASAVADNQQDISTSPAAATEPKRIDPTTALLRIVACYQNYLAAGSEADPKHRETADRAVTVWSQYSFDSGSDAAALLVAAKTFKNGLDLQAAGQIDAASTVLFAADKIVARFY